MTRGPGSALLRALVFSWAIRAFSGWLVALPAIAIVAGSGIGALPQGDRALFEPGGMYLVELLRTRGKELAATAEGALVLFALALALSTYCRAVLFAAGLEPEGRLRPALSRALERTPRFLGIALIELIVMALSIGAALLFAGMWSDLSSSALSELGRGVIAGASGALGFAGAGVARILGDAVRASSMVEGELRFGAAVRRGLGRARAARFPLTSGYVLASGAGALLVALVARGVELADVSQSGAWRVALCLLFHQGALFGLSALEALWIVRVRDALELGQR